jgi:nucleosome-remodeling factor subunit
MIVEVPRWTNAKMEISKSDKLNPIKQDLKKGKLRYVHNCFPHHGYIFNYGALPQTWEDPKYRDESTGCLGDNDPLDVCEIGYRVCKRGEVRQVKVLGLMALIDEGETDWKIIAIDVADPQASSLNDIGDIEGVMPGLLKAIHEWFKIYKMPTGNPPNKFAFGGQARDKAFAERIIQETNSHWKEMICGKLEAENLSLANTTVQDSPFRISKEEAESIVASAHPPGPPGPIEPDVDKWHYVDRDTVQAVMDY